ADHALFVVSAARPRSGAARWLGRDLIAALAHLRASPAPRGSTRYAHSDGALARRDAPAERQPGRVPGRWPRLQGRCGDLLPGAGSDQRRGHATRDPDQQQHADLAARDRSWLAQVTPRAAVARN